MVLNIKNYTQKQRRDSENENIGLGLHFICQSAIHVLIIVSLLKDNAFWMTLTVGIALIYACFSDIEEIFYLIAGLSIYQFSFTINGNNAVFMLVGIFLVKMMIRNRFLLTKSTVCLWCALIILIIQCANDVWIESKGEFLVVLVFICFFLYIISNIEVLHFDVLKFLLYYSMAVILCSIYVFNTYGGIVIYIKQFLRDPNAYRFGIEESLAVGGAMEIPLYCLMVLSVSVIALIYKKNLEWWKRLSIGAVCFYVLIIGALTVSRSFLLGVGVLIFFSFIVLLRKNVYLFLQTLLVFFACLIVFYLIFPELFEKIIFNFFSRIEGDYGGGTGRTWIWKECLTYLWEHPLNLFFGGGASRYLTFGSGKGFTISAGAHNLIIDVLMSWGIIGLGCFLILIITSLFYLYKKYGFCLGAYLPFLTYLAFSMTALRTTSLTTWAYLIATLLVIAKITKENTNDS